MKLKILHLWIVISIINLIVNPLPGIIITLATIIILMQDYKISHNAPKEKQE